MAVLVMMLGPLLLWKQRKCPIMEAWIKDMHACPLTVDSLVRTISVCGTNFSL